jgi:histone H3/H4
MVPLVMLGHKHISYIVCTQANIFFLATVQKIVTEILPASTGLTFGKDARDLLIECCVEFITLISSEANEISEKESKKTIACEHITKALEQLGFGEYVPEILEVASEHKEALKVSQLATAGLMLCS